MSGLTDLIESCGRWLPLVIFLCRVADVSIGTVRTILVVRGAKFVAPVLGFVEVTIWILAVSSVVKRLDDPVNVIAYAAGFATGNYVGMLLESKLAIGQQIVRMISRQRGHSIAHALRINGFGVTTLQGRAKEGPTTICFVIVPRKRSTEALQIARKVDPNVFATIEETRTTNLLIHNRTTGPIRTGWRAIFKKK